MGGSPPNRLLQAQSAIARGEAGGEPKPSVTRFRRIRLRIDVATPGSVTVRICRRRISARRYNVCSPRTRHTRCPLPNGKWAERHQTCLTMNGSSTSGLQLHES